MEHNTEIAEIVRIFTTRLATLDHILSVGEQHLPSIDAALLERLAPDMHPLGTQIAFTCNQPWAFARWCAGQPPENLEPEVATIATARAHLRTTQARLAEVRAVDSKLDETKRTGLGPGLYCETPARFYVSDFLMPNFYFHMSITYAILRKLGVPLGKADFMSFLLPYAKQEG